MKNISKSYFKLFLKLWVETIGVVVFLTIFTMLVIGMLAIPLQMTTKTDGIKSQTNLWNQQRQSIPALTNYFIDKYFINFDKNSDKNISINSPIGTINIKTPTDGWFSKEALSKIDEYTDYVSKNDAKDFCGESSNNEEKDKCEKEYVKSAKIDFARSLIDAFYLYGDDKSLTIADGSQIQPIIVKDIFTNNGSWLNYNNWSTRSVEDYIIYQILQGINQNDVDVSTFMSVVFNESKPNTSKEFYQILLTSATSLENDNIDLNNLVFSDKNSRLPQNNQEVVINDRYSKLKNININDKIIIKNKEFKVVGIGSKYSTISPTKFSQLRTSIDNYFQVYLKNSYFYESSDQYSFKNMFLTNNFISSRQNGSIFIYNFENYLKFRDKELNVNSILWSNIDNAKPNDETGNSNQNIFSVGVNSFKDISEHTNIKALNNLFIMTYIYLVIGIILFILGFSFVIFILKKEISNTRNQLGVFKALGYKTSQLTWIFALKNFVSMFISFLLGYFLSIPFQIDSAEKQFKSSVTIDFDYIYHDYIFLTFLLLIIPLIFSLFAYFIIYRVLNVKALDLINTQTKRNKRNYLIIVIQIIFFPTLLFTLINHLILKSSKKHNRLFTYRLQNAFVNDNKGKFILIISLFGISSFLFTMQLRALPILKNMFESGYNIYSKEVNHYYNFNSINNLKYSDNGLMKNNIKPNYQINYSDISENENYIENEIIYSKNITNLINNISDYRNEILKSNEIEQIKSLIPIISNLTFLLYPLENNDEIDIKTWVQNNIWKLISSSSNEEELKKIIDDMMKKPNILNIKPINENKNSGIYVNDIAKYVCVSIPGYSGDCNDLESFKEVARNYNNDLDFGQQVLSSLEADNTKPTISTSLKDWISTFLISEDKVNPFISANKVLFDKTKELLTYNLKFFVEDNQDIDLSESNVVMFKSSKEYGDPKNIFNFNSISNSSFESLSELNDDYINGLISFRLAKLLNLNVNDKFIINIGNTTFKQKIRIAGIISDNTLLQEVYLDYDAAMSKIAKNISTSSPVFTNLYSTKEASEGEIDITDIRKSIDTFRNKRDLFSYASTPSRPWLATNLDLYINNIANSENANITLKNISKYLNEKYLLKPFDTQFFINPGVVTFPILKELINSILGEVEKAMLTYIIIDVILLTILLIVLINVIINDAINIITVMRSLGYTNKKINWIILGRYIIFSFIGFLIGYGLSLLTWSIIQSIVWNSFKVVVTIPTLIWLPFVSGIILGSILYIGWMTATIQIRKKPLTLLLT
ncbi:ABC transporter permease [Spiroplasma turonicum]|uniref:ABC transporter permease n=1 Tax=Spiroplasma turonicum TaxID=216946 RepID=A0A0K1P572_9MOLU|nr:ABC transporter permease [Spiroplasma turonicum]AKU79435.1 ABC transporter permease [Spiroplasma turonicum]ALX70456.1 ABC transporter permease [Spiroplasma turonicum]